MKDKDHGEPSKVLDQTVNVQISVALSTVVTMLIFWIMGDYNVLPEKQSVKLLCFMAVNAVVLFCVIFLSFALKKESSEE